MHQAVDEVNPAVESTPPQALSQVGQQRYNHALECIQTADNVSARRLVQQDDELVNRLLAISALQLRMVQAELMDEVKKNER